VKKKPCYQCTLLNPIDFLVCEMCGAQNPGGKPPGDALDHFVKQNGHHSMSETYHLLEDRMRRLLTLVRRTVSSVKKDVVLLLQQQKEEQDRIVEQISFWLSTQIAELGNDRRKLTSKAEVDPDHLLRLAETHEAMEDSAQLVAQCEEMIHMLQTQLDESRDQIKKMKSEQSDAKEQLKRERQRAEEAEQKRKAAKPDSCQRCKALQTELQACQADSERQVNGLQEQLSTAQRQLQTAQQQLGTVGDQVAEAVAANQAAADKVLAEEKKKRRALLEKLMSIQGNIRVYVRVRPLNARERDLGDNNITKLSDTEITLTHPDIKGGPKTFEFNKVFGVKSKQEDIFEELRTLVDSFLDGHTVCVFAYGQTGCGKTFTMEGNDDDGNAANLGVNYRALDYMFLRMKEDKQLQPHLELSVVVSVVEVYNEQIRDLLAEGGAAVRDIRQDPKGQVYMPGLVEIPVLSRTEVRDIMQNQAYPNRCIRATNMNAHSSRSHCLVFVTCSINNTRSGTTTQGTLVLVDLAGSERLDKSGATGDGMKEALAINKSLSALGNVIANLQKQTKHIPFRDSKLTYLLQNSLGGSCKCVMFCNVSPAASNFQETNCSLEFALRVNQTKLGTSKSNKKTEDLESKAAAKQAQKEAQQLAQKLKQAEGSSAEAGAVKAENKSLQKQITALSIELNKAKDRCDELSASVQNLERVNQSLEAKVAKGGVMSPAAAANEGKEKRLLEAQVQRLELKCHKLEQNLQTNASLVNSLKQTESQLKRELGSVRAQLGAGGGAGAGDPQMQRLDRIASSRREGGVQSSLGVYNSRGSQNTAINEGLGIYNSRTQNTAVNASDGRRPLRRKNTHNPRKQSKFLSPVRKPSFVPPPPQRGSSTADFAAEGFGS